MLRFLRFCWRHKFLTALMLLGIMSLLAVVFHRPLLKGVGSYLLVSNSLEKADVIRVLGGSPDRYLYGFELYKRGYAPKIVFSLWNNYLPLIQKSTHQVIDEFARANDVPAESIEIVSAESTYHEAVMTLELIESENLTSVLVVSSPYHMRRISIIFEHVIGDRARLIYAPVPPGWTDFQADAWWTDEESSVSVIHEYIALVYYYFKYILFQ